MKKSILFSMLFFCIWSFSQPQTTVYDQIMSRTEWWREARLGMYVQFGLFSIPGRGVSTWSQETMPDSLYLKYYEEFNPVDFDAKALALMAKQSGAKYAIMCAKHHDGFCLYDSKLTDFKVTNTVIKRDLFREFVNAFREQGIKVGLMYSLIDWHHPDYVVNDDMLHPRRNDPSRTNKKVDFLKYITYMQGQLKELLTNYGKMDILCFEYSYYRMDGVSWKADELMQMVRKIQPDIIVNNGLGGPFTLHNTEIGIPYRDYETYNHIIPDKQVLDFKKMPIPWETRFTLNNSNGYNRNDQEWKSASILVHSLVECVSKNGNMTLQVDLNPRGEVPQPALAVLEDFGKWMHKNGKSIYGCGPVSDTLSKPDWGWYTINDKFLYAHVFNPKSGPITIKHFRSKYEQIRLLEDGGEVNIDRSLGVVKDRTTLFINLDRPAYYYYTFPDLINTVFEIKLK